MSRNGLGRSLPFATILIWPPCCTTNSRPEPSPAPVTNSGASRPPVTSFSPTRTLAGSNAAPGAPVEVEADALGVGLEDEVDGVPDGPADEHAEARTTRPARI